MTLPPLDSEALTAAHAEFVVAFNERRASFSGALEAAIRAYLGALPRSPLPPAGPWTVHRDEHGESREGWRFVNGPDDTYRRSLWFDVGEITRAEVFAICDALNRVASPALHNKEQK